jgi:glutaredoxin-dependent peroxiredoxin
MLKVGDKAPVFKLPDSNGNEQLLTDFLNESQIVILFFPLAFSDVCSKEMCSVRDNMKMYRSLDVTVIGISVDSIFTLKAFKKVRNLNFRLLSDFNKEVSRQYDVLCDNYYGMKGVSKRASFVISQNGLIKHVEVLEDSGELPDFRAILKSITS